ncbi:MAG TPA: hypothetical protein VFV71_02955 [Burkholderiales bacterium]|nr:hypothetical protein [Burkholderiales bacterium]
MLLLLGPSGAGKTTLAGELAARGWLHYDLDQWQVDGLEQAGLRAQWAAFSSMRNPAPLAEELARRLAGTPRPAAVLSFPSRVVFGRRLVERACSEGFSVAILFGAPARCLDAFRLREAGTGRNLDVRHWQANNADAFRVYGAPGYEPWRVNAFHDGGHRSLQELADEVVRRCAR